MNWYIYITACATKIISKYTFFIKLNKSNKINELFIWYFPAVSSPHVFRPWETRKTTRVLPVTPRVLPVTPRVLPVAPRYTEPVTPPGVKLPVPVSPAAYDSGYHSNSPSTSPVPSDDRRSTGLALSPDHESPARLHVNRAGRGRTLSVKAVDMLEAWYHDNNDHPYPSTEIVEYISEAGNLTHTQVRKWLANKRVRSRNTLSYNCTIHPKRFNRLCIETGAERTPQKKQRHHPYTPAKVTKQIPVPHKSRTPEQIPVPVVPVPGLPVPRLPGLSYLHPSPYMPPPHFILHLQSTINSMPITPDCVYVQH